MKMQYKLTLCINTKTSNFSLKKDIYKFQFHLHKVDSHTHSCSDEHHITIYAEVLVYCPLNGLKEQDRSKNVDEHHTEDCRYHL